MHRRYDRDSGFGEERDERLNRPNQPREPDIVEDPVDPNEPAGAAGAPEGAVGGIGIVPPPPPPPPDSSDDDDFEDAGQAANHEDDSDEEMAADGVKGAQLQTIPLFNGEESVFAIKNFVVAVDRAILQFNWAPERVVPAAQSRLIDQAQTWVRGQTVLGYNWEHWNDQAGPPAVEGFKTALLKRFGKVITSALAVDAVQDLKQKEDESVSRFYDRVLIALDRKNYIFDDAAKQQEGYLNALRHDLTTFFLGGLRSSLRNKVLGVANPPNTPSAARDAAKAAEAEESRARKPFIIAAASASTTGPQDEQKKEDQAGETYIDQLTGEVCVVQRGRGKLICFRCKGEGHYQADCATPAPRGRGGRGGRSPWRGRGGRGRGGRGRGRANSAVEKDDSNQDESNPDDQTLWDETQGNE